MGPSEPETVEMSADIEAEGTLDDGSFACGVVEGMPLLYWVIFVFPHKHPYVFFKDSRVYIFAAQSFYFR